MLTASQDEVALAPAQVALLHERLLRWYAEHQRDLPWRRTRDPYAVWVSEIMLQQTRVDTVLGYYDRFLARFPSVLTLAEAPPDDVFAAWSGLGYYRRARLLHEGARAVAAKGGVLPADRTSLLDVPGIGKYTAGAIASIAFGEPVGLVDGNVARVFSRVFGLDHDMRKQGMRIAEKLADRLVAREDPGAWNQALMELGATVCTPRTPACHACPLAELCRARAENRVHQLPVLSPKTPAKAQRVQAVVALRKSDGGILMMRRRADGLFGGLWEPPSVVGTASVRSRLAQWLPVGPVKRMGSLEHVLSHRVLSVDVLRAELTGDVDPTLAMDHADYDAADIILPADLSTRGISTLARKVLTMGTHPQERLAGV